VAIRLPASRAGSDGSPRGAWSDASRNDPVTEGMAVRTAAEARAVLRVGGDLVAIAGGSEADIVKLDGAGTVIALRRGRIGVRLPQSASARVVEITIPSGALRLSAPGEYDVAAGDAETPARVAVPVGEARFSGKGLNTIVATGAGVLLIGGDPMTLLPGSTDEDAFAAWSREQKHDAADAPVLRHVSAEVTGHEMLDGHGVWETVAGIGDLWFPTDAPSGWMPYRFGHWRWVGPWGWTWVDDMPWGFATSHYGRWAKVDGSDGDAGRWGWMPGKRAAEPAFMPAAVAFLGTAGVGLSYPDAFSPAVAWFPLAPGEVYWPSFTDDPAAISHLNAAAVADTAAIGEALKGNPPADIVTGQYRNRRDATVVPRPVFVNGKPIADAVIELPVRRLENAPLLAGSPGIEPAGTSPPIKAAVELARRGAPANLAKARDVLTRIVKWRESRKHTAEAAVSRGRARSAPALEKRDARKQHVAAKRAGSVRVQPASSRPAGPAKTRLRKAERPERPAKSRSTALRVQAGDG
ncbi:MAG: DUF6600 domain-containing protein, partial [Alphaproteobacteria bacterium]